MPTRTLTERFWPKVNKSGPVHPTLGTPCWLWVATIDPCGYGRFRANGALSGAHRVAYELVVGPIPDGLTLDHLCRVRACVNPAHLEPVTMRENILRGDGPAAAQAKRAHCPKGHPYDVVDKDGRRRCRSCRRAGKSAANRALVARKKAEIER